MPLKAMCKLAAFTAFTLLLGTPGAQAADGEGVFAIRGYGSASCQVFLSDVDGDNQVARIEAVTLLTAWLGGYLTHANRVTAETFDIVPLVSDQDVLAVIAESCRQAPDASVASVAQSVVEILSKLRVTAAAEAVEIAPGTVLRAPVVVAIQQRLIDLGHLAGAADGAFGANSMAALESFKTATGLDREADGLTLNTFLRLFESAGH